MRPFYWVAIVILVVSAAVLGAGIDRTDYVMISLGLVGLVSTGFSVWLTRRYGV